MCKTMGLPRVSTWFRPGKRGAPEVEHATLGVDQLIDELFFVMFLYVCLFLELSNVAEHSKTEGSSPWFPRHLFAGSS